MLGSVLIRSVVLFVAPVVALGGVAAGCNSGGTVVTVDAGKDRDVGAPFDGSFDGPFDGPTFETGLFDAGVSDGQSALCDGSPCQPIVLATGTSPSGAGGLVVDATNVYWVDSAGGQVLVCAKTGCGSAPTVLASGQGGPSGIAVSGGTAYWTNVTAGTVASCAVAGCGGIPTVVATGLASPGGITADATSVYWTETGAGGSVDSCATSGCVTPTVLAAAPGLLLAVDATTIYFTDGKGVNSCPLAGCTGAPTVLFAAAGATGIAIDTTNVYVTANPVSDAGVSSPGTVLACAKAGCAGKAIALATAESAPLPIAVDATNVYWGNTQADADIWACAVAGCKQAPTAVTMAALALSLAVDDTNLYWASAGVVLTFSK
jgi:hypothetical protein